MSSSGACALTFSHPCLCRLQALSIEPVLGGADTAAFAAPSPSYISERDAALGPEDLREGVFFRAAALFVGATIVPAGAGVAVSLQSSAAELALASVQQQRQPAPAGSEAAAADDGWDDGRALSARILPSELHSAGLVPSAVARDESDDSDDDPDDDLASAALAFASSASAVPGGATRRHRTRAPRPQRVGTAEDTMEGRMSAWTAPAAAELRDADLDSELSSRSSLGSRGAIPGDGSARREEPLGAASRPRQPQQHVPVPAVRSQPQRVRASPGVSRAAPAPRPEDDEENEALVQLPPVPVAPSTSHRSSNAAQARRRRAQPPPPGALLEALAAMGIPTVLPQPQQLQYDRAVRVLRAREGRAALLAAEAADAAALVPDATGVTQFAHALHSLFGGTQQPDVTASWRSPAAHGALFGSSTLSSEPAATTSDLWRPAVGLASWHALPAMMSDTGAAQAAPMPHGGARPAPTRGGAPSESFLSVVPPPARHGTPQSTELARQRAARYRAAVDALLAEREMQRREALVELSSRRAEAVATAQLIAVRVAELREAERASIFRWRRDQSAAAAEAAADTMHTHASAVARARELAQAPSPSAMIRMASAEPQQQRPEPSLRSGLPGEGRRPPLPRQRASGGPSSSLLHQQPGERAFSPLNLEPSDTPRTSLADHVDLPPGTAVERERTAAGGGARAVRARRNSLGPPSSSGATRHSSAVAKRGGASGAPAQLSSSYQDADAVRRDLAKTPLLLTRGGGGLAGGSVAEPQPSFRSQGGIDALLVAAEADAGAQRARRGQPRQGGRHGDAGGGDARSDEHASPFGEPEFSPAFIKEAFLRETRAGAIPGVPPFRPPAAAPGIPDFLKARYQPQPTQRFADSGQTSRRAPPPTARFVSGAAGEAFGPVVYDTDPSVPVASAFTLRSYPASSRSAAGMTSRSIPATTSRVAAPVGPRSFEPEVRLLTPDRIDERGADGGDEQRLAAAASHREEEAAAGPHAPPPPPEGDLGVPSVDQPHAGGGEATHDEETWANEDADGGQEEEEEEPEVLPPVLERLPLGHRALILQALKLPVVQSAVSQGTSDLTLALSQALGVAPPLTPGSAAAARGATSRRAPVAAGDQEGQEQPHGPHLPQDVSVTQQIPPLRVAASTSESSGPEKGRSGGIVEGPTDALATKRAIDQWDAASSPGVAALALPRKAPAAQPRGRRSPLAESRAKTQRAPSRNDAGAELRRTASLSRNRGRGDAAAAVAAATTTPYRMSRDQRVAATGALAVDGASHSPASSRSPIDDRAMTPARISRTMGAWPGNEEASESPSPTPEPLPKQVAPRHRDLVVRTAAQKIEGGSGPDFRGAAAYVSSTAVESSATAGVSTSRVARFTSPPLDLVEAPRFGSSNALPPTSVLASHTTTQIKEAITALRLARAQGVDVSSLALNDDLRAALVAIGSGAHVSGFPDAELQALLREVTSLSRGAPLPAGIAREASEPPMSRATESAAAITVDAGLRQHEPGTGGEDSDDSGSVGRDADTDTPAVPQEALAPPFDALPPPTALVSWQDDIDVGGGVPSGVDHYPDLLQLGVQPVDDDSVSVSGSDQEESEGGADAGSSSADGVAWHTEPEPSGAQRPLAPPDPLDPLAQRRDKPLSPKQRVLSASKSAKPAPSATVVASGPPSVAPPLSQQRSLHSRGGAAGNNSVAGGASLASATMHGSVGHLLRQATSRRIPVARIASRVMMQPPPEVLAAEEEALKVRVCKKCSRLLNTLSRSLALAPPPAPGRSGGAAAQRGLVAHSRADDQTRPPCV